MADANKVRYGLKNLHRAEVVRDGDKVTFGTPVRMRGAVSITFTKEGSDSQDFHADDEVYYVIDGTNGGYSAELTIARLGLDDREALLGESYDDDGVQFETTDDKAPEWAYIMEMQGDFSPIAFCFYCGKASRIDMNANTKGENVEVDTDTVSLRFTGIELPWGTETKSIVQGHMEKTEANAEKYKKFLEEVHMPNIGSTDGGSTDEGTEDVPSADKGASGAGAVTVADASKSTKSSK